MEFADRGLINGTRSRALKALRALSILSSADLPSCLHCTCAVSEFSIRSCPEALDQAFVSRKTSPVVSIAQIVRASLFATATATTRGRRRSKRASIHGPSMRDRALRISHDRPCSEHQEVAQIAVPLLGDASKARLPSRRVLPRRQAQPGGELAA